MSEHSKNEKSDLRAADIARRHFVALSMGAGLAPTAESATPSEVVVTDVRWTQRQKR